MDLETQSKALEPLEQQDVSNLEKSSNMESIRLKNASVYPFKKKATSSKFEASESSMTSQQLWLSGEDGCEHTETDATEWGSSFLSTSFGGSTSTPLVTKVSTPQSKKNETSFIRIPHKLNQILAPTLAAETGSSDQQQQQQQNEEMARPGIYTTKRKGPPKLNKRARELSRMHASDIALDPRWDIIRESSQDDEEDEEISCVQEETEEEEEDGAHDSSDDEDSGCLSALIEAQQLAKKRQEEHGGKDEASLDPMDLWAEPSLGSEGEDDSDHEHPHLLGPQGWGAKKDTREEKDEEELSLTLSQLHEDDRPESPQSVPSTPSEYSLDCDDALSVASSITWDENVESFNDLFENDESESECEESSSYDPVAHEDILQDARPVSPCGPMSPLIGRPKSIQRFHHSWSNPPTKPWLSPASTRSRPMQPTIGAAGLVDRLSIDFSPYGESDSLICYNHRSSASDNEEEDDEDRDVNVEIQTAVVMGNRTAAATLLAECE
uniref:Uncharacterized protein n=1 Tax=Entomoneis paludosa TaxID=265537 RepID=A0A7S3DP24_9STRA|mmetsp:Transcript_24860/g.51668  ORF Transcript_24860/g.51668 Transcript_24860/m.51668 type:complete len:496 (+) Transcript_24860:350-1837(+)|eukprot:CAMPEP_0172440102 /NCGR_PEP_ID=MMETSP1065-20121228/862_1 /TAXON_ID=265537 /ORGANISM="Amphiprora paludosa, Strain CCMP125" /LENGTH=495 /DNA_ID=CAMNT_0013188883 /DNA_START=258 /DNA_END=1745 /DNA_ORIENTATION=-